jgi:predicted MFS family arabinose efflux permease
MRAVRGRLTKLVAPMRQVEIRVLLTSQLVSGLGDWAGRLALSVLVFERSDSALWTAMVTVASLLPWLGIGQMLATYADRFGRITVMVTADLARAVLFVAMLIPQPTWLLLVLAFLAGVAVPPFMGSRSSALVEVAAPELYGDALALAGVLSQLSILAGYAGGGLLVALVGPEASLAANAATFVVSALMLSSLRSTRAGQPNVGAAVGLAGVRTGVGVWRADPVCLRTLVLFVGVASFMILPEVLVVPLAAELDVPDGFVGAFAALVAIGAIIGSVLAPTSTDHVALLRVAALRAALLAALTAGLFAAGAVPAIAAMAFLVSGVVDAVGIPTNQIVGQRLPAEGRAAAMSVAIGALYIGQVIAITGAGVLAVVASARVPLAVGSLLATAVCIWAALRPLPAGST